MLDCYPKSFKQFFSAEDACLMGRLSLSCVVILLFSFVAVESAQKDAKSKPILKLNQTDYLHRWSQNDQHEFTPRGQEDLQKWTDMLTVNVYRQVTEGEGLALAANQVLERYKSQQARVLRTDSVPRTAERPAEHLIVVVFGRPTFLEAVLARFKLVGGKGASIIYSHRVYGKEVGAQMSTWLRDNGPAMEKSLMSMELASVDNW